MILRFDDWLIEQQYRDDLIGDLARAAALQEIHLEASKRRPDEHRNWADIVTRFAEPGHIIGFNMAWQEFLLAKQSAKDDLD
jgi:hypothetical protein